MTQQAATTTTCYVCGGQDGDVSYRVRGSMPAEFKHVDEERCIATLKAQRDALLAAAEAAITHWHSKPSNIEKLEPEYVKLARAAIASTRGVEARPRPCACGCKGRASHAIDGATCDT